MTMQTNRMRWLALGALALVLVAIGLDLTILNVALPSLANDLNASATDLQWFVNVYALVMAASLVPAGRLGDRIGPRRLILASVVLFTVASIVCACSGNVVTLIIGRGLLGASAGVFMPLSMSMLTRMFTGQERSKAISVWTASVALGIPIGPLAGGWLLDHYPWGSVFIINVPLGLIALVILLFLLPAPKPNREAKIDLIGILLASTGMLALTYGCTNAGDKSWGDIGTLVPIAVGVIALVALVYRLGHARNPLFSLTIFDAPAFFWGCIMATLASLVMMTTIFLVPQFAQVAYDTNAFGLGLRLLPFIGGLVVAVPIGERLIKVAGYRLVLTSGFALMIVATVLATQTSIDSPSSYFLIWSALLGSAVGFTLPNSMDLAMSVIDAERSGVGSGIIQSLRQLGGTMGVAILGTALFSTYRDGLKLDGPLAQVAETVRSSPAMGALVARKAQQQLPDLLSNVQTSFLSGMHWSFLGMAAIAVLAVVLAAWRVPQRAGSENSENVEHSNAF